VTLNNEDGCPIEIQAAEGSYSQFNDEGKLGNSLRLAAAQALDIYEAALKRSRRGEGTVVDLGPSIQREQWRRENRWELSKEDLDVIAADIWGDLPEGAKLKNVKGTAPSLRH
jgi:hypothetical protein